MDFDAMVQFVTYGDMFEFAMVLFTLAAVCIAAFAAFTQKK